VRTITGREALAAALQAHVDAGGLLLGEAVGTHGIAAGTTGAGVRRTTLSENATVGEAAGAALTGARVVVELLDGDGLSRAGEALADAGTLALRSEGAWSAPLVVLAPWGSGPRAIPGVDVHAVGTADDAAPALAAALASGRASVVLTCDDALDGAASGTPATGRGPRVLREGSAHGATVFAAGPGVQAALAATEGRDATVVDVRTLAPLDAGALRALATRTGRLVVVELPELLALATREAFLSLESPPALVRADAGAIAAAVDAATTY
jgi:pyruvate dehydrogenase E1 component beta subunit